MRNMISRAFVEFPLHRVLHSYRVNVYSNFNTYTVRVNSELVNVLAENPITKLTFFKKFIKIISVSNSFRP